MENKYHRAVLLFGAIFSASAAYTLVMLLGVTIHPVLDGWGNLAIHVVGALCVIGVWIELVIAFAKPQTHLE